MKKNKKPPSEKIKLEITKEIRDGSVLQIYVEGSNRRGRRYLTRLGIALLEQKNGKGILDLKRSQILPILELEPYKRFLPWLRLPT